MENRASTHLSQTKKAVHVAKLINGRVNAKKKRASVSKARSLAAKASHVARAKIRQQKLEEKMNDKDAALASMDAFYEEIDFDEYSRVLEASLESAGINLNEEQTRTEQAYARLSAENGTQIIGFMAPPSTVYALPPSNATILPIVQPQYISVVTSSSNAYAIPTCVPSTSFKTSGNSDNSFDSSASDFKDSNVIDSLHKKIKYKDDVIAALKSENNRLQQKLNAQVKPSKLISSCTTRVQRVKRLQEFYDTNHITTREAFELLPATLTPDEDAAIIQALGISEHRRAHLKRRLQEVGLDILSPTQTFHAVFEKYCIDHNYVAPLEDNGNFADEDILGEFAPTPNRKQPAMELSTATNDGDDIGIN